MNWEIDRGIKMFHWIYETRLIGSLSLEQRKAVSAYECWHDGSSHWSSLQKPGLTLGQRSPLYSARSGHCSQPPEYEIRKQRHEPSRHNFPNHLILFKFPHALLALVDQNEAQRRAFPWLFYCTNSSVHHLRKRVGNWGFASLSQGYLKLAAILQLVLFPAFNRPIQLLKLDFRNLETFTTIGKTYQLVLRHNSTPT